VKLGFKTVAIARGQDKVPLAHQLGAHQYIDNATEDPAATLQKLGGAKAILATVTSADAMNSVQGGLATNGTLLVIGAVDRIAVDAFAAAARAAIDQRLVFRHVNRFAGNLGVQRANRGALDERDSAARARRRRLRAHDQRSRLLPRRVNHWELIRPPVHGQEVVGDPGQIKRRALLVAIKIASRPADGSL
jgi:NADPH:quinone reductase-like Zn-dependent oxidoreductase